MKLRDPVTEAEHALSVVRLVRTIDELTAEGADDENVADALVEKARIEQSRELHLYLECCREKAKSSKLTIDDDGIIAVAEQALVGETYARAAILAHHLTQLASKLDRLVDAEEATFVDGLWSVFANARLGETRRHSEKRQQIMLGVDAMAGDETVVGFLTEVAENPATGEADRKHTNQLRSLIAAWRATSPGAKAQDSRVKNGKWVALSEMYADKPFAAAPKTWENDWLEIKSDARRPRKK